VVSLATDIAGTLWKPLRPLKAAHGKPSGSLQLALAIETAMYAVVMTVDLSQRFNGALDLLRTSVLPALQCQPGFVSGQVLIHGGPAASS
jgi:hypothetical protein